MGVKRDWYVSFTKDGDFKHFMVYDATKEQAIEKAVEEGYVPSKWYQPRNITLVDFDVKKMYSGESGISFDTREEVGNLYKVLGDIDNIIKRLKG